MAKYEFKQCSCDGEAYYTLVAERNDNGITPTELDLQKRILKLKINIQKCGSFQKMEGLGGAPTQRFLRKTRNLLREYLFQSQTEYLACQEADIAQAIEAVDTCEVIYSLVEEASWEKIETVAQNMRNRLVEDWFKRKTSTFSVVPKTA